MLLPMLSAQAAEPNTAETHKSETIIVVSPPVEPLATQFHDGLYDRLLQAVIQQQQQPIKHINVPVRRATMMFKNGRAGCYFPGNAQLQEFAQNLDQAPGKSLSSAHQSLISSDVINTVKLHAYTQRGSQPITSSEQLKGVRIGYHLTGQPPFKDDPAYQAMLIPNEYAQLSQLLDNDRLDVAMMWSLDTQLLTQRQGMPNYPHDPDLYFDQYQDALVCHNSERNRRFIALFNRQLKALKSQGQLLPDPLP